MDRMSVKLAILVATLTAGGMIYTLGRWILVSILASTFETQQAHAEDMNRHESQEVLQRKLLAEEIVNRVEQIHHRRDR
jgi:hypothetical protein